MLPPPAPLHLRPIALVGMMGAGKSSVGRRLAQRLGRSFIDADDAIELAAGMGIDTMFARHGEGPFRDGERRIIARLLNEGHGVLATGGGAFVQPDTRALLNEQSLTVWLDVPLDVLVERVSRRDHRPLLRGKDARTVLSDLLDKRRDAYAEAHVRVAAGEGPHGHTVGLIVTALRQLRANAA